MKFCIEYGESIRHFEVLPYGLQGENTFRGLL